MPITLPYNYTDYNIISVDPGLNNFGVCIININDNTVKSIKAFTLKNDSLKDNVNLLNENNTERIVKLYKLKNTFLNILQHHNPILVISESPFFNPTRPSAFSSLTQVIQIIQMVCYEHNNNISFNTIEPLLVKKTVNAGMTSNKLNVKDAIKNITVIMNSLLNNIELLDEHSIDAIAIGYSFIKLNISDINL